MAEPQSQGDGQYVRANGELLKNGQFAGLLVSVVGSVENNDGTNCQIRCSDDVIVKGDLSQGADVHLVNGAKYELVGSNDEAGNLIVFVAREMGSNFDLVLYNRMLKEVMHNPKFTEYFQ